LLTMSNNLRLWLESKSQWNSLYELKYYLISDKKIRTWKNKFIQLLFYLHLLVVAVLEGFIIHYCFSETTSCTNRPEHSRRESCQMVIFTNESEN
jgi:hypothetical protein